MSDRIEVERQLLSQTKRAGIISLGIAVLVLPFAPICVRWSVEAIDPIAAVFYRFFFAGLVFATGSFWNLPQDRDPQFNWLKIIFLLLGIGICDTANQLFWVWSIERTYVGNCSFINSLTPLFVALFAWLFLQRSFDRRFLMGTIVALGGSLAIGIGDIQIVGTQLQGDIFALVSAICRAAYLLIAERLRVYLSASNILFSCCLLGSLLLFPILFLGSDRIIPHSGSGRLAIVGLVLIFIIGRGMLMNSLKSLSANIVTLVFLLEHFLVAIQGWIFFAEILSLSQWLSFAIVVLGVYLAIFNRDRAINE